MTELIEASNYYQTRRHYAAMLQPAFPAGNSGQAICGSNALPVDVFDQEHQNATTWGTVKQVTTLPLCKRCERKAAKEGMEVPS